MGLSIAALSNLELVGAHEPPLAEGELCEFVDHYQVCHSFPHRADDLEEGCYAETAATENHWFCAGSYTQYGRWRDQLAAFAAGVPACNVWADPDRFRGSPCYELIHFSDCDGIIGPAVSAKLASDFARYRDAARRYAEEHLGPDGEYWMAKYEDWMRAFTLAAQGGMILFA